MCRRSAEPIRSVGKSTLLRIVGRLHRSSVGQKHGPRNRVLGEVTKGTPQGDVISTMALDVGYDPLLVSINTEKYFAGKLLL